MEFETGLDIEPTHNPMGFSYGKNCFGPQVENRSLDAIRKSLMNPNCDGPVTVYSIAMNVGKKEHKDLLEHQHLLFGVVTYVKGKLGKEPIRSQGHIHKKSEYANGWSTPEVYQIWSGKAVIYMQEYADDNPGRCFAITAAPGDIVIVPPDWAHATISADPSQPLTFGAWCDLNYGFEYDKVRAHKGLAWYPIIKEDSNLEWVANKNYDPAELIIKKPENYAELGLTQQVSIYKQYEDNPTVFDFVPKPFLEEEYWKTFTP